MIDWNNCFSNKRLGQKDQSQTDRSDYERDYDRIIFSSAFRRLQNKTQVFPLPEYVFVHNRLTHSLEVASVGRSLGEIAGKYISNLPEVKDNPKSVDFYQNHLKSVVAAACLAHDLGNPAFGHSGEEAISKYFIDRENDNAFRSLFSDEEWSDLVRFEGNANALRILGKQFYGRMPGGYQLTYPTLASILKYPCASHQSKKGVLHLKKYGYFQADKEIFNTVCTELNMQADSENPGAFLRHPFVFLVEAADDICYNIIDYEDAHRLGILSTKEVKKTFKKLISLNKKENLKRLNERIEALSGDANELIAYLRAKSISTLVYMVCKVFEENAQSILEGKFNKSLLDGIDEAQDVLAKINRVSTDRIYNYKSVIKIELSGFKIMSGLITDFLEAALLPKRDRLTRHKKILKLIPHQYHFEEADSNYEKVMSVLDFVSGMTDLYALELYKNLRGIEVPSI